MKKIHDRKSNVPIDSDKMNVTESQVVQKRAKKQNLDKSVNTVNIAGLRQIKKSRIFCAKLFWSLLLLFSICMALFFVFKTIDSYYTSPISTAYAIVSKDAMDMPQIYICPSNPIRKSYAKKFPDKTQLAVQFQRDNTTAKHSNDTLNSNIGSHEIKQIFMDMGTVENDFFVFCQFRSDFLSMIPCKSIFTPVFDAEYGKCFLFDAGFRKQVVISQGVTFVVNLKTQEFPDDASLNPKFTGLVMGLGKPFDPSSSTRILIPAKTYSKVDITEQRLKFIDVQRGPSKQLCNKVQDFPYNILNVTYTQSSCRMECFMSTVAKMCRCIPLMDEMFLQRGILDSYRFCTLAEMNTRVEANLSDSEETNTCKRNCHIPCDSARYITRVTSMPLEKGAFSYLPPNTTVEDIIYIQVAFPYLEYEEFSQTESMTVDDMVGNIGGNIGLWLGTSMLSLIQIPITLMAKCSWYLYNSWYPSA